MESKKVSEIKVERMPLWKELFGLFTTREFWVGVASKVFQETIHAVIATLGGVLLSYGNKNRDKEILDITAKGGINRGPASGTNKAFSGVLSPSPNYQPSGSNYPVATQPYNNDRFPGFSDR